jgi:uncharacterized small protein (DUF1192 family)
MANYAKDAADLADKVKRYCAEIGRQVNVVLMSSRGAGNHRWVVTEKGRSKIPLVTFSAHSSHAAWRPQAESDLRRVGLLPPAKQQKKETATVPRLTTEEETRAGALRVRIENYLLAHSRAELYEKGFDLIQNSTDVMPYTGSGTSSPEDLCQTALKRFLDDGKGWKQINLDRWAMVMDELDKTTSSTNGSGSLAAPADGLPGATEDDLTEDLPEIKVELDDDTTEMLVAAEEMLKAAENERDDAQKKVLALTAQVESQDKALKLIGESHTAEVAALQRDLETSAGRNEELRRLQGELDERIATMEEEAVRLQADIERYGIEQVDPEQEKVFRARYFDVLSQMLIRAGEKEKQQIAEEIMPRIDKLTGVMLDG